MVTIESSATNSRAITDFIIICTVTGDNTANHFYRRIQGINAAATGGIVTSDYSVRDLQG